MFLDAEESRGTGTRSESSFDKHTLLCIAANYIDKFMGNMPSQSPQPEQPRCLQIIKANSNFISMLHAINAANLDIDFASKNLKRYFLELAYKV